MKQNITQHSQLPCKDNLARVVFLCELLYKQEAVISDFAVTKLYCVGGRDTSIM